MKLRATSFLKALQRRILMGIAERRAAKDFETRRLPELKQQIDAAAGFELPLEMKWETIAQDGYANDYDMFFTNVYFKPLVQALQAIAIDDMGKEALKGALKKVIVQNTKENGNPFDMPSFADGVLTLDHSPSSNFSDMNVSGRVRAIRELLEKHL
jgi:hypothetical protein